MRLRMMKSSSSLFWMSLSSVMTFFSAAGETHCVTVKTPQPWSTPGCDVTLEQTHDGWLFKQVVWLIRWIGATSGVRLTRAVWAVRQVEDDHQRLVPETCQEQSHQIQRSTLSKEKHFNNCYFLTVTWTSRDPLRKSAPRPADHPNLATWIHYG